MSNGCHPNESGGCISLTCLHPIAMLSHDLFQHPAALAPQIKSKTEKKKDKFFTMDPQQITFDMVRQKLKDIVMTRGKRGVDRNEQVEMLTYLASVAKGPVQKIEVLIQVVSALFDINPSMSTHMSVPLWKRCAGTLLEVLQTLADNDYIEVDEAYDNPEERTEEPPAGQPAKVCLSCALSCVLSGYSIEEMSIAFCAVL